MRKWMALLAAVLLLAVTALAEETDVQPEANAAYAQVVLAGAEAVRVSSDAEEMKAYNPLYTLDRTPVRFTVLDMDGDGVGDMVLELAEPEEFVILFWQDGQVLALEMPYRGLLSLKDDGSHEYSSGAADGGVCTIGVEWVDGVPLYNRFVQASMSPAPDTDETIIEVNGEAADLDAYHAFLAQQDAKLDALWYDYTEDNVKLLLGQ